MESIENWKLDRNQQNTRHALVYHKVFHYFGAESEWNWNNELHLNLAIHYRSNSIRAQLILTEVLSNIFDVITIKTESHCSSSVVSVQKIPKDNKHTA